MAFHSFKTGKGAKGDCGKVGFMLDIRYRPTFDLFLSVNLYAIAEYSWIMLYLVQITFKNIISKIIIIIFDIVIHGRNHHILWGGRVPLNIGKIPICPPQ